MGIYLNPGNEMFRIAVNSDIYVDKSMLISYANSKLLKEQRFMCVSRPRRFGKSMAANMLAAYYSKGCDSSETFQLFVLIILWSIVIVLLGLLLWLVPYCYSSSPRKGREKRFCAGGIYVF